MKKNSKSTAQKVTYISRRISISFFIFFLLFVGFMQVTLYLKPRWGWLLEDVIVPVFTTSAFLVIVISCITPGLLYIFLYPELGHAWLYGMNPVAFSSKPWEQMSRGEKFLSFLQAMATFSVGLLLIYAAIINGSLSL